jgi:hypothetical protein
MVVARGTHAHNPPGSDAIEFLPFNFLMPITMNHLRHFILACMILGPCSSTIADITGKWFLMARHGECHPVRSLERKFPEFGSIDDPERLASAARARGMTVDMHPVATAQGRVIELRIPERGLALLFATGDACNAMDTR